MDSMQPFRDPAAVARYAEGPPRIVPGFADLQRMALLLLSESVAERGDVLVLGAGGGLELKAFALTRPGWRLLGVDPSAEMLALARMTLGDLQSQTELVQGTIEDAPVGPFDGGTCLLTLHFLGAEERLRTLRAVRARLRPGGRFVVAHHSFAPGGAEGLRWSARGAAFAAPSGELPARPGPSIAELLPILSPAQDEAMLRDAGFRDVELFYAAFTFRGWVATA